MRPILISALGIRTAAGNSIESVAEALSIRKTLIKECPLSNGDRVLAATIPHLTHDQERANRRTPDRTAVLARECIEDILDHSLQEAHSSTAIFIGSSRGATGLTEKMHEEFLQVHSVPSFCSPGTTAGAIASACGQTLARNSIVDTHSMTCVSSHSALLNGIAWLEAGMVKTVIGGGVEACITPFTVAQMAALGIYSKSESSDPYPCRPLASTNGSSFTLGEGAALFRLDHTDTKLPRETNAALGYISGFGFSYEKIESPTGIDGDAIYRAMERACKGRRPPDAIVVHATGTVKGDQAELDAIHRLFHGTPPLLVSNKWLWGHTLGASGAMNVVHALAMLKYQELFGSPPYLANENSPSGPIESVLINAAGFGGVSASLLIKRARGGY